MPAISAPSRVSKLLTVKNVHGLHARPATDFVRCATRFGSTIQIQARGQEFSAKRVVDVLFANLHCGFTFTLVAEGPDAAAAVETLEKLLVKIADADRNKFAAGPQFVHGKRDLFLD